MLLHKLGLFHFQVQDCWIMGYLCWLNPYATPEPQALLGFFDKKDQDAVLNKGRGAPNQFRLVAGLPLFHFGLKIKRHIKSVHLFVF